jgi:hypothetical protein
MTKSAESKTSASGRDETRDETTGPDFLRQEGPASSGALVRCAQSAISDGLRWEELTFLP